MMQLKVHNTPQEVFLPERVKPGFNQASDVTTTIQEFQETEEYAIQHYEEEGNQVQKMGHSMEQRNDSLNIQMTSKTWERRNCYRLKET